MNCYQKQGTQGLCAYIDGLLYWLLLLVIQILVSETLDLHKHGIPFSHCNLQLTLLILSYWTCNWLCKSNRYWFDFSRFISRSDMPSKKKKFGVSNINRKILGKIFYLMARIWILDIPFYEVLALTWKFLSWQREDLFIISAMGGFRGAVKGVLPYNIANKLCSAFWELGEIQVLFLIFFRFMYNIYLFYLSHVKNCWYTKRFCFQTYKFTYWETMLCLCLHMYVETGWGVDIV